MSSLKISRDSRDPKLFTDDIIEDLVRPRSLNILVGTYGLEKRPFLRQLALCVAAGIPFLGREVRQGRVIHVSYTADEHETLDAMATQMDFRGLNSCGDLVLQPLEEGSDGPEEVISLVRQTGVELAVIDSLNGYDPKMARSNGQASLGFNQIISETTCAFLWAHECGKSARSSGKYHLENADIRHWLMKHAKGVSEVVRRPDLRLGLSGGTAGGFVLRGFRRTHGEVPPTFLVEERDEEGVVLGYRLSTVHELLPEFQRAVFETLPEVFSFKEARRAYRRKDQATRDFLKKCESFGLLTHEHKGPYEKTKFGRSRMTSNEGPGDKHE